MIDKKKFPFIHQTQFMLSPYLYPEIRYHVFTAGYGAGKTSAIATSLMYDIAQLSGKKDREGRPPRLLLGGVSLGHLKKTTLGYLLRDLDSSKTPYEYDKKDNILTVAGVQIFLVSLTRPQAIVGFDVVGSYGDECFYKRAKIIVRRKGSHKVVKKKISFLSKNFLEYEILTPLGWRDIAACRMTGRKEIMRINNLRVTYDHKVASTYGFKEAHRFKKGGTIWQVSLRWIKKVESYRGELEQLCMRVESTEQKKKIKGCWGLILGLLRHLTYICIGQFGKLIRGKKLQKDFMFIIKMVTHWTIVLATLNILQHQGTSNNMLRRGILSSVRNVVNYLNILICLLPSVQNRAIQNMLKSTELQKSVKSITEALMEDLKRFVLGAKQPLEQMQNMPYIANRNVVTLMLMLKNVLPLIHERKGSVKYAGQLLKHAVFQKLQRVPLLAKIIKGRRLYEVYDLTVATLGKTRDGEEPLSRLEHSFYANNINASNCDDLGSVTMSSAVDMTFEAVKAINERTRQRIDGFRSPFIKLASTSQGQRGLYRICTQFDKEQTAYVRIKAKTSDNTAHPPGFVESLYQFYTPTEAKVYLEGEFLPVGSGRIFPDFDWEHNFSRVPMDQHIRKDEELFWAQDFNSLSPNERIATDRGYIKIRDLEIGTGILTRKGYRKLLTKKQQGTKIVVRCGNLWSTLGHPFITAEGEMQRCQIQSYYYLKKRSRLLLRLARTASQILRVLPFSLTERFIKENQTECISFAGMKDCTEPFMNTIMERSPKTMSSIIKMGLLIIVLKILKQLHGRSILKNITRVKGLRSTGRMVVLKLQDLFVVYAGKLLQDVLQQPSVVVQNVVTNGETSDKEKTEEVSLLRREVKGFGKPEGKIKLMFINFRTKLADCVALSIKEHLNPVTAYRALKNVMQLPNGRVLYGVEREIWDIEVEGEHEFFAENILVHNSGFFRGCIGVLRGNTVYVIKRYEFQQIMDAPQVVRYDFPENKVTFIPDATSNREVITFALELKRNNINWAFRTKNANIEDTVFLVNKLLWTNRLIFTELAKETAEGCALAIRDPKTGMVPKGIGPKSPIHDIDSLRMLCYYLVWQPAMKDIRALTIQRRVNQWVNEMEEDNEGISDIQAVSTGGGFTIIDSESLDKKEIVKRGSPFN